MRTRSKLFPTPEDAENAFYDAFERANIALMMAVWAETDDIVCIHPRGPRLTGFDAVRESWVQIFSGGSTLRVRTTQAKRFSGQALAGRAYDLTGPESYLETVRKRLIELGAVPAGHDAYETARIAAGIPRFGADITPDNFPGESENALERAVNFGKGCYPGQETVARMHYRGSPNKKLYRLELEPDPMEQPEPADEIVQGEKVLIGPVSSVDVVGWLTSVAPLPVDGRIHALGYLARKADPQAPMRAEDARVIKATST